MKKIIAFMAAAAMTLSMFTACGSTDKPANNNPNTSDKNGETIKIGAMGPYTGDLSIYGISVRNGIEQAVNEINANGGIDGKQIELITMDDKGDPNECVNAYNKLRS